MNAMRQSLRPKHQVLVLKCYPKFQKGASDVLPNSSELSYLLHYASTRRSKITKVASFLEKKSEGDISKLRIGNVQVTLQICRALIEKSPRDLPLYAPHILHIFELILQSKNLVLVEESVPAFQALCEHEDTTTLPANPKLAKQLESVVQGYADIAQNPPTQARSAMSAPNAIRWKMAGLQAIKSVTASEAVALDHGRQLNVVIPVILENLYSDGEEGLIALNRKAEGEKEFPVKQRRLSITTNQSQTDIENAAVTKTAAESDRIAEEEAGLIAYQSLKQIFVANNRGQVRLATSALLKFLVGKTVPDRPGTAISLSDRQGSWTTTLIEMVAKWTPVQDRFTILVTAVENLVQTPIKEENMEKQLVLATLIEWLLSSTFNMIGLSVMDVLLGLVKHILALLHFGDQIPTALPHHEQTEAIDLFAPENEPGNRSSVLEILNNRSFEEVRSPSWAHQQLLSRLRKCIGSLATHIYYSDQVSDIVSALLLRLKPNSSDGIEGGESAPTSPRRVPSGNPEFFSFGTARVTALNAVKDVIHVANRRSTVIGAGVVGRNRIGLRVWEGTEWLLRDNDVRVRRAYVEALMFWLRYEVTKQDFRVLKDPVKVRRRRTVHGASGARAAGDRTSSATAAGIPQISRSTFLPLLHVSIYEDALEAPETDANILLLHLLMYSLIERLGVNAVRAGLPMIRRLQEDINTSAAISTPKAKVNIGSLVHGYFWSCYNIFDFETTAPGYEVSREISRRKKHGLWLLEVQIPPQNVDMIIASYNSKSGGIPLDKAQNESLRPFDSVQPLIDQISISYERDDFSPPTSRAASPARASPFPNVATPGSQAVHSDELPGEFKEDMSADWSKEACLAAAEKEKARSTSPTGSKSGTARSQPPTQPNGLIAVNGTVLPDLSTALEPVQLDKEGAPLIPDKTHLKRHSSPHESTPFSASSDFGSTLHIGDLKKALAGGGATDFFSARPRSSAKPSTLRGTAQHDFAAGGKGRHGHGPGGLSNASDSLVDADGVQSDSEYEAAQPAPIEEIPEPSSAVSAHRSDEKADDPPKTPTSPSTSNASPRIPRNSRPRSNSDVSAEDPEANALALKGQLVPDVVRGSFISEDDVPPVPPLPRELVDRNSRNSNRQRGEALAPGVPWSGPSSGRSSSAGLTAMPQLSTAGGENGSARASSPRSPHQRSDAFEPGVPRGAPPVQHTFSAGVTGEQRPESLLAAASANAAGAAAALAAITAIQTKLGISSESTPGNSGSVADDGAGSSAPGSRSGSVRRGGQQQNSTSASPPRATRDDNRMVVQALLGSIEVGEMGSKGIGRPPV